MLAEQSQQIRLKPDPFERELRLIPVQEPTPVKRIEAKYQRDCKDGGQADGDERASAGGRGRPF